MLAPSCSWTVRNLSWGWLCGTVAHDSLSLTVVGHFLCPFGLVLEQYFFWEFAHCVQIFKVIGLNVFHTTLLGLFFFFNVCGICVTIPFSSLSGLFVQVDTHTDLSHQGLISFVK